MENKDVYATRRPAAAAAAIFLSHILHNESTEKLKAWGQGRGMYAINDGQREAKLARQERI